MDPVFVAVEGIDGAGTTTCSKLLVQKMHDMKLPCMWTKEPSEGTIGRHIRKILKGQEAADELGMFPLFLADRHDHIASIIRPNIEQGTSVICDRYAYSTWVYQQDNYDPFLLEYMQRACLAPDILFVLLCPVEECMKRLGKREVIERYEIEEKQRLYHERYKRVPRLKDERVVYLDSFNIGPEETVRQMLVELGLD
jgi:dTMP kinase